MDHDVNCYKCSSNYKSEFCSSCKVRIYPDNLINLKRTIAQMFINTVFLSYDNTYIPGNFNAVFDQIAKIIDNTKCDGSNGSNGRGSNNIFVIDIILKISPFSRVNKRNDVNSIDNNNPVYSLIVDDVIVYTIKEYLEMYGINMENFNTKWLLGYKCNKEVNGRHIDINLFQKDKLYIITPCACSYVNNITQMTEKLRAKYMNEYPYYSESDVETILKMENNGRFPWECTKNKVLGECKIFDTLPEPMNKIYGRFEKIYNGI